MKHWLLLLFFTPLCTGQWYFPPALRDKCKENDGKSKCLSSCDCGWCAGTGCFEWTYDGSKGKSYRLAKDLCGSATVDTHYYSSECKAMRVGGIMVGIILLIVAVISFGAMVIGGIACAYYLLKCLCATWNHQEYDDIGGGEAQRWQRNTYTDETGDWL